MPRRLFLFSPLSFFLSFSLLSRSRLLTAPQGHLVQRQLYSCNIATRLASSKPLIPSTKYRTRCRACECIPALIVISRVPRRLTGHLQHALRRKIELSSSFLLLFFGRFETQECETLVAHNELIVVFFYG